MRMPSTAWEAAQPHGDETNAREMFESPTRNDVGIREGRGPLSIGLGCCRTGIAAKVGRRLR